MYKCFKVEKRTSLTDSAISGPMPSPGKRVARIKLEFDESEAAAAAAAAEKFRSKTLGRLGLEKTSLV